MEQAYTRCGDKFSWEKKFWSLKFLKRVKNVIDRDELPLYILTTSKNML